MALDKSKFISTFLLEVEGYLKTIEDGLVKLEQAPDSLNLLEDLFRAAHTIKGSSRMMGFQDLSRLAHQIENVFGLLREKKIIFESQIANIVFASLDLIKTALKNISQTKKEEIQIEDICEKLKAVTLSSKEDFPSQAQETKEKKSDSFENPISQGKRENSLLSDKINMEEHLSIPMSRINHLINLIGEVVVSQAQSSYKVGSFKKLVQQVKSIEKIFYELKLIIQEKLNISEDLLHHEGNILRSSEKMKEEAELLGKFQTLESSLRSFHQETQKLSEKTQNEFDHLSPILENLQQKIKEIRMLPCADLFQGFPRLVRDIAQEQNKKVRLLIEGEGTELDKKILESLKAPLIHLLRNAVDHGIENGEERKRSNKPEIGTIRLSASQEGGKVILTLQDDGGGIDPEKITKSALEKKILSSDQLSKISSPDLLNLIFKEGFSTAPIITEVSGRGVGLSVVETELRKIKSNIKVESEIGKGTLFRIEVPLTIAILQVLLVESEGFRWALPILEVEECLKINLSQIPTLKNQMVIQSKGSSIPLLPLSTVLGIAQAHPTEKFSSTHSQTEKIAIILHLSGKRIGLVVDRVLGEQEVFIKNIGSHLKEVKGVSGTTILASGEMIVILNNQDLLFQAEQTRLNRSAQKKTAQQKMKKKILIVEDSLTTRELEKTILENHGYEVETAIDGIDALEKLQTHPFDCVVSDIQMPRMDGFELCKNIKTSERLKTTPVIFVTSLLKDQEKRRGIEVGAQAYITKSQFDQANLLETIERLV